MFYKKGVLKHFPKTKKAPVSEFCETSILLLSLNIFVSLDNLSSTFNGGELKRIQ